MTVPVIPGIDELVEIGRGGNATVYRGRQSAFDRVVAVKVLDQVMRAENERAVFERECRAIGTLSGHPGVVTVHDAGVTAEGRPYLVMEHLPSGLDRLLRDQGPLPWEVALNHVVTVATALQAAHDRGVLHRDVKPENILLTSDGDAKLADFGLARVRDGYESRSTTVRATLTHVAPEILDGDKATVSSDVYALASTFHHLVSGRPPFARSDDESLVPLMKRIVSEPPPPLEPYGVPAPVVRVIAVAMAKDPAARPATALQFADELVRAAREPSAAVPAAILSGPTLAVHEARRRVVETPPVAVARRRRRWPLAAAVAIVVLATASIAFGFTSSGGGATTPTTIVTQPPPPSGYTLPNFVGWQRDDVQEWLDSRGLIYGQRVTGIAPVGTSEYDVVAQDPAAGMFVEEGIRVWIDSYDEAYCSANPSDCVEGQSTEAVPETVAEAVTNTLPDVTTTERTTYTLPLPVTTLAPATTVRPVTTSPPGTQAPGTQAPATQPPPPPPTTQPPGSHTLPNFVGGSRDAARAWLMDRGLLYGQRVTGNAPAGTSVYEVVAQDPSPGTVVGQGTRVWIYSYDAAYCDSNPGDCW